MGVILMGLFGLALMVGGGYGVWSVVPWELVTTSVCVRSSGVEEQARRTRRGFRLTSKELQLQGATQSVTFYHDLGTVFMDADLPSRIRAGDCYRVEVRREDHDRYLRRTVSAGYGRRFQAYGRGELPRVKMYSMSRGESVMFTPFDAYGWEAIALGLMGFLGLAVFLGTMRVAMAD
jgi:hypothetical protein